MTKKVTKPQIIRELKKMKSDQLITMENDIVKLAREYKESLIAKHSDEINRVSELVRPVMEEVAKLETLLMNDKDIHYYSYTNNTILGKMSSYNVTIGHILNNSDFFTRVVVKYTQIHYLQRGVK